MPAHYGDVVRLLLVQHTNGRETFAAVAKKIWNILKHFNPHLIRAPGNNVRVQLGKNFLERQIDQPGILRGIRRKNTSGSVSAEFSERNFDAALRKLLQDLLHENREIGADDTGGRELAP